MPIHKVGNFKVEVLHEEHLAEKRIDVLIVVYEGREFLDLVRFDFRGFNSGELRKEVPSLTEFYVKQLAAVMDDAREWPKEGEGKGRQSTRLKAKETKKPKAGITKRPGLRKARGRQRRRS